MPVVPVLADLPGGSLQLKPDGSWPAVAYQEPTRASSWLGAGTLVLAGPGNLLIEDGGGVQGPVGVAQLGAG